MECLWIREEESIGSRVFRFIPVVPLLGWEVARAFLFSCVFSSNPNTFLSLILFAPPPSLGSLSGADLGVVHLPDRSEGVEWGGEALVWFMVVEFF